MQFSKPTRMYCDRCGTFERSGGLCRQCHGLPPLPSEPPTIYGRLASAAVGAAVVFALAFVVYILFIIFQCIPR